MISWLIYLLLTLPFIMLAVIFALALMFYKKRNKQAARQLIAAIKSAEEDDKQILNDFLVEKIGINEKEAKKLVKKAGSERKFFFRNLIASLLNQKVDVLAGLNDDLNRMLAIYHGLEVRVEQAESPAEDDSAEKIEELKAEIKNLKHEVHITLTTLNNIFAEFSSMFGEEVPNREMSVDQIITAMESFAGKGQVSEATDEGDAETTAAEEEIEVELSDDAEEPEQDSLDDLVDEETVQQVEASEADNFSIDDELDEIDSALDELELSAVAEENGGSDDGDDSTEEEPSWDEAFEESGDKKD